MATEAEVPEVKGKGKGKKGGCCGPLSCELNPPPVFLGPREDLWKKHMDAYKAFVAAQERKPITITLPDGATKEGKAWETNPFMIAEGISRGLAENTVIAKVNGDLWDMDRPLEGDCTLKFLNFDDDEGRYVYWHSSAHILGEAMERVLGGHLAYGPPIEEGFYYDMWMHENGSVKDEHRKHLQDVCQAIMKEKQPFERLELKKSDLLDLFSYNVFKQRILNERVKDESTTVYKCGPLIDLCRGPHIRHTGKVKAMCVTKTSSAYWEGKNTEETLQRVYGMSFPDAKKLKEWQHFQEEAAKRDHRRIGLQQDLFFFHDHSPGSCFFLPRGAHIYNKLVELIREQYQKRGFQEVISPNIYNSSLWMQSGHWQHYQENIFQINIEKETFGLKPMNCPGHCVMFAHKLRSYKELPLRLADFGVLHRNELSGALSGLTRVRRFQQDDAHIFCREDQIGVEIRGCLDFLAHIYGVFGFTFKLYLSTRPEKYMGDIEVWNRAEAQLSKCLDEAGLEWKLNPGDGAFYGPKIDITIMDALRRSHQCATIQLDFQLPEKFDLSYMGEDASEGDAGTKRRPVIIHRAILGSVERCIAILTENCGGKWPFWLSPMQAIAIPVVSACDDYAREVQRELQADGFKCDLETDPGKTLNKKVRNAQLAQYNFIFVIGEKEKENRTVNVRTRDNKVHGEHPLAHVISRFRDFAASRCLDAEEKF